MDEAQILDALCTALAEGVEHVRCEALVDRSGQMHN